MRYDKPRGYALGGVVGGNSNTVSQGTLTPININIGGNTFGMTADRDVAEAMQRFFNSEGGY